MFFNSAYAVNAGQRHTEEKKPCEDSAFAYAGFNSAFAVVCDGVGSRMYARETADCVVKHMYQLFETGKLFDMSEKECAESVNSAVKALGFPEKMMGSTLVCCAVRNNCVMSLHMGDGIILADFGDGFKTFSAPENGMYANETFFFPEEESVCNHLRVTKREIQFPAAFILASDGVSDLLHDIEHDEPAAACKKIKSLLNTSDSAEASEALKAALSTVMSQYSYDDQSIAAISSIG